MAMALFSSQFVKMHVSSKGKLGCLLGTVLDPLIRPQTWQTNNLVMGKLLNGMEAHTHTHISNGFWYQQISKKSRIYQPTRSARNLIFA